jgi:ParB-like chromosome segregation protein Spo0J
MMREQHELSKAYPPMSEDNFQDLKDSIEVVGLLDPITIYEDKVIDGWHRYTACLAVSTPHTEVDLPDDVDPIDFVRAKNGKSRRHMTPSQLALSEVSINAWAFRGNPKSLLGKDLKSAKEMAEKVGVSVSTIERAKEVISKGSDEVIDAVKTGKVSVKKAASVTKLPKEKQVKALTEPPEPKPSILDGNTPDDEELKANELAMKADMDAITKLLESDDALATAYKDIKRLNHLVAQKDVRIASIMREKSECIKLCQSLQKENDKLKGKK